jgi:hypothetical protein
LTTPAIAIAREITAGLEAAHERELVEGAGLKGPEGA